MPIPSSERPSDRHRRSRPPPDELPSDRPLDTVERMLAATQFVVFGFVLALTAATLVPIHEDYVRSEATVTDIELDGYDGRFIETGTYTVTLYVHATREVVTMPMAINDDLDVAVDTVLPVIGVHRCQPAGVDEPLLLEDVPCALQWYIDDPSLVVGPMPAPRHTTAVASGTVLFGAWSTHGVYRRWWGAKPKQKRGLISADRIHAQQED